jgi:OHCU decarboxylase
VETDGKAAFVARYGTVWEHSPWIAEAAFDADPAIASAGVEAMHRAMVGAMRQGGEARVMSLIAAHPDLAGRLAHARELTPESAAEQASAGLDALTADERARFTALNDAYRARFGFPFIIAVRGQTKADILAAFERRLKHRRQEEIEEALRQIERIAFLRLDAMARTPAIPPA